MQHCAFKSKCIYRSKKEERNPIRNSLLGCILCETYFSKRLHYRTETSPHTPIRTWKSWMVNCRKRWKHHVAENWFGSVRLYSAYSCCMLGAFSKCSCCENTLYKRTFFFAVELFRRNNMFCARTNWMCIIRFNKTKQIIYKFLKYCIIEIFLVKLVERWSTALQSRQISHVIRLEESQVGFHLKATRLSGQLSLQVLDATALKLQQIVEMLDLRKRERNRVDSKCVAY